MSSIGPQVPAHLLPTVSVTNDNAAESDEDDYTPALPPELAVARGNKPTGPSSSTHPAPTPLAGPSTPRSPSTSPRPRRVIGPALQSGPSHSRHGARSDSEDSDTDVGPQPLPAHVLAAATSRSGALSGVEEFLEREARRRQNVEEAAQPKKLVREAWMLVPPKAGDLLSSLDPTKLKSRQFGRGTASARDGDTSLWTETPAERQQRLADEVSGRKRRAVNAEPVEDEEEARKRRRRDAEIRMGVEEHTRKARGPALVDAHMEQHAQKKKDVDEPPPAIWDHSRDMSLGGRLMDDKQRQKLLRDAKGLGDRFGTGKSGGFL
ncbi:hypothetical protein JVU11DRAFT_9395 [Chiua virens]|nr:hypothetical protein JVU11DRAFT_9395 [Chiua virens]